MAKILQADALKVAAKQLELFCKQPELVAKRVILAYLNEKEKQPKNRRKVHPVTREMAAMEIGDELSLAPIAHQVLRSRMKTCRVIMNNAEARWICREIGNKTIVRRMPDSDLPGANNCYPGHNPRAVFLANIEVGTSQLAPQDLFPVYKGSIDTSVKI